MSTDTINTTITSSSTGLTFVPAGAWVSLAAPGATNGQAKFDTGNAQDGLANSYISYTFSQPATRFQFWAYQRSDGGLFSICFDCPATSTLGDRIDALNTTADGSDPPRLLYSKDDLSYAFHNVTILNLFDSRATIGGQHNGGYGQINMDRFLLITPSTPPSSSTSGDASNVTSPSSVAEGSTSPPSPRSNTRAIVGGVIGGIIGLAIIVALILLFLRFRRRNEKPGISPYPMRYEAVPQPNSPMFALEPAHRNSDMVLSPWSRAASAANGGAAREPPPNNTESTVIRPLAAVGYTSRGPKKGARPSAARPVTQASELVPPSLYPPTSESSWTASSDNTVVPRRERDAGFLQGDAENEASLPPDYTTTTAPRGRR
ncbi:hypothetical protein DACRYDRAFT_116180 [Dacryopinax primogenitus]|uniref:Mid2 domain-containing protein n=1 Tax=Dacryopinax primogenitus (strain DJM 731) TaxID=1858805 RepID=M5G2Q8_DACPD|nr:uncharacterized protein DACRYDRAFT_116180 [Dacryopinax primogenitus]EJU02505.1 hypothetical protein DACRYDRAFT_116180 [Dacryopinax primogenitus]